MTTPRQPYGPDDRERAEWDPYHHDPYGHDADDGTAAWGRPAAGGWGAAGTGYDEDYGGRSGGGYGDEQYGGRSGGSYRGGPPADHDTARRGARPAAAHRDGRYREPGQGRHDPSWGQGAPMAPRRSARRRRRAPWVALVAAGVVVVAVLVLGFVVPGWFVTRVFDASAVQSGVTKILTDSYDLDGVADVHCPTGVPVASGATFTCDAAIDGDPVKVPIRIIDDKGAYEVGRPT